MPWDEMSYRWYTKGHNDLEPEIWEYEFDFSQEDYQSESSNAEEDNKCH